MGWRDRDWAKFTPEEFDAIYGGGGSSKHRALPGGSAPRRKRGVSGARVAAAALLGFGAIFGASVATGQIDKPGGLSGITFWHSSKVPSVPVVVEKSSVTHRVRLITGTRILRAGGSVRIHGTHAPVDGSIVIRGKWGGGAWITLGVASGRHRSYSLRVPLNRRGVLHIRVAYPDGSSAVGTYQVS